MPAAIDFDLGLIAELLGRCWFPAAGAPVVCAVSGGADSLALLVLAGAAGCHATAVHVDHDLREGSAGEADVVADAAARCGAAFRAERVFVEPGPNLEARARTARFSVLPRGVLTGHTADDRAETVLLNLMRGAGPTGAIGIARSPSRPLLDLRRSDTVRLCASVGLEPVDDPSNRDPSFRRNRVRHELIPMLDDISDRDVASVLVRQADLFAELDELLDALALEVDATSVSALAAAPRAVARAALRSWLADAGVGKGYPVDAAAVERVLAVAQGTHVATQLTGGWRVARSKGRLRLVPPGTWQDADHG